MPHWPIYLSTIRILLAPTIAGLAWLRHESWYLIGLTVLLIVFTCGRFLMQYHRPAALGTPLVTVADILTFLAVPAGGWLLFPHLIIQERVFVATVLVTYIATIAYGHLKLKRYRRRSSLSISLLSMLLAVSVLTAYITNNTWMFRICALILLLAIPRLLSHQGD